MWEDRVRQGCEEARVQNCGRWGGGEGRVGRGWTCRPQVLWDPESLGTSARKGWDQICWPLLEDERAAGTPTRRLLEESRQVSSKKEKTREQHQEKPAIRSNRTRVLDFWREGPGVTLWLEHVGRGCTNSKDRPHWKRAGAGEKWSTVWDMWSLSCMKILTAVLTMLSPLLHEHGMSFHLFRSSNFFQQCFVFSTQVLHFFC